MPYQAPAPDPNFWGHPDRTTPKFDPKFDLYKTDWNPFGGPPGQGPKATDPPRSHKAPIIEGGSIPEIQDDIVKRDRERMEKGFWEERRQEAEGRHQEKALRREEEEQQRQREQDIREMSELDRRTPKYGKFEGFPLSPPPGPEPAQNPFSPEEKKQRINQLKNQPN